MLTVLAYILAAVVLLWLLIRFVFPKQFVGFLVRSVRYVSRLQTHAIDVGGRTWHYLDGGPRSGEVLLLLHGFGGDKDNWPLYARRFTKDYRVVIPDLPGFGDNFRDDDADYRIAAQAERLHAFLGALRIDRMHIAGNSMGGFLALRYALDYPAEVQTITLLNNAGVTGKDRSELELRAENGESPLVSSTIEEFEWLMRFIVHKPVPIPMVIKQHLFERARARHDFLNRLFWSLFDEIRNAPLNDQLPRITAPTLVIWGRHDRLIDVSCADAIIAGIPNSRCVIFEDMGHVPMLERPGDTADLHYEHLQNHRAA